MLSLLCNALLYSVLPCPALPCPALALRYQQALSHLAVSDYMCLADHAGGCYHCFVFYT